MPDANHQPRTTNVVLVPVFDDWAAATTLIAHLDTVLDSGWTLLIVDDGSVSTPPIFAEPRNLASIKLLRLRRNLGHQRAIAIGLTHTHEHIRPDVVVVMDGDGEDDPSDLPRLLQRFDREGKSKVVFAERRRRTESLLFVAAYHAYRALHRVLTGVPVRVGNFSVVPASALSQLVVVPDLWNHYAASVYCSRIPFTTLPTDRARRYAGRSKMNVLSLVVHGLSAIAVFRERVAVRLLTFAGMAFSASLLLLFALLAARVLWPELPIPGSALMGAGILVLVLLQVVASMLVFAFVVLGSREQLGFLPLRDYSYFVAECRPIATEQGAT
jgi:polyisoprenyl-phosphate glycosyltransferase